MQRLFGEAVDPRDAANLAVALLADGRPDAVSAAIAIEQGLPAARDVQLTAGQRAIVAYVVENHTRSLSMLKSMLAGD